jgi:rifampicin phosphotransferase
VSVILFHHEASKSETPPRDIGGKARGLARAERAGFAVPAWFVILPEAFEGFERGAEGIDQSVAASGDPAKAGAADELTAQGRAQLARAVAALCPNGDERLAVRSSASDEDGAQHSFAGQLESILNVAPTEVEPRVRDVWRSGFSERILAYRREHGLSPMPRPPAVIVQRMVQARAAGVAFSADPISGRRGIAVVGAVRGLGDALVSGEADADTWRIDRQGTIIERQFASRASAPADASGDEPARATASANADGSAIANGSAQAGGASSQPMQPALADHEVLAIARLAREAARRLGQPQDIEWAFEGDQLLLLQARPITTLATRVDPDGVLTIWDNSNIVESYSGVTTPLTFSFASDVYAHVYRQFCRLMRVPAAAIDAHDDAFRNMLGLVRGRLYYNLPNWYRVLALLPGYRVNRAFMEQMMGVREPLPAEVADQIEREMASTSRGRVSDAFHLTATLLGLLVNYATLDRRVRAFTRLLDDALAAPNPPLEDRRPDELAAHYRELRQQLLLKWDAPLVNDFFAMIFYGVLRSLVRKWCGDEHGTLQNDLVGGAGGMVSAEPAIRMHRLARLAVSAPAAANAVAGTGAGAHAVADAQAVADARADADADADADASTLRERLQTGTLAEIERELTKPAHAAFRAEYAAYLEKFGERTVNELKLESATFHDDPLPLLRAIGNLARQRETAARPHAAAQARARADEQRETQVQPQRQPQAQQSPSGAASAAQSSRGGETHGDALRVEAQRRVRAALARHPLRRVIFGWVLRHAQTRVRDRENLRLERTRLFGRIRRIMREMGRRLREMEMLEEARHIFYLEVDEILALVEGRSTCTNIRALAAIRRAEFDSYANASAPPPDDRFETRGLVYQGNDFRQTRVATSASGAGGAAAPGGAAAADADERRGLGCCPGIVRGRVRVVFDPRNVTLDQQTILVAEHTDPGWILIFPAASGLLVERGSLLSHAAIVARELGIPAVVSLPGLTRWLRDGDEVEIDGSTGLVRRLSIAELDAAGAEAEKTHAE